MVIIVALKDIDWKHRYEKVVSYEVVPKEKVQHEVDCTTYNELDKYIFRMHFEDGEQATFGVNSNFSYKVLSYDCDNFKPIGH